METRSNSAGISVPPELLVARHVGMRALVSNIGEDNIDVAHRQDRLHDEVLESGSDAADKRCDLVRAWSRKSCKYSTVHIYFILCELRFRATHKHMALKCDKP